MSTTTPNYNLNKFDGSDDIETFSRLGFNDNADIIDTALKGIQDDIDGLDASEVSYDNTVSGLTATDVQAALDEELGKIDILYNSVSALADYSTTEEQVIGTYDGKPLYRKVFESETFTNAYQVPIASVSEVLDISVMAKRKDYNIFQPAPSRVNDGYGIDFRMVEVNANNVAVNVTFGSSWGAASFKKTRIILEYTKTTD